MKNLLVRYINPEVDSLELKELCVDPDDFISQSTTLLKDDRTTTLCKTKIDIGDVVIKRYNTKNLWHGFRRNFQTSRAKNCQVLSEIFGQCHITVAQPLAVIEGRCGILRGRSWFISRFINGDMLLDYLGETNWQSRFEPVKRQVMQYFKTMQAQSLSHGDMKATNILVGSKGLVMIDLDASKKHRTEYTHKRALLRDKKRFLKNWNNIPQLRSAFSAEFGKIGLQ